VDSFTGHPPPLSFYKHTTLHYIYVQAVVNMSDPLLSSLCRVCNTHRPKYRCPRCLSQTCSLACSKRHKVWSECNGIRDPTAYKPKRELSTPAGIDHDYNFITSIERGIERSDKLIVEEKGLIQHRELFSNGRYSTNARHKVGRELGWAFQRSRVIVEKAPSGMRRNKDNGTNWNRAHSCINWQVEWIQEDGSRVLGKALETQPIGEVYATLLEEERRAGMTTRQRKQSKKRKAAEIKEMEEAKKAKLDVSHYTLVHQTTLQNPISSTWDITIPQEPDEIQDSSIGTYPEPPSPMSYNSYPPSSGYYFYLQRPHTPSSKQRVVIPLHPSAPLSALLRDRVVLEFPTIYVLSSPPTLLPKAFIREDQYLNEQPRRLSRYFPKDGTEEGEPYDSDSEDSEIEEGEIS
jgi:HIT zinc finger